MKDNLKQSARAVLMVQPLTFGFDVQTAETNSFQVESLLADKEIRQRANDEFDAMVAGLRAHGVTVQVYRDADLSYKPNAVFPNNWLSMWPDGTVYLYPMATESRRVERSQAAINEIAAEFKVGEIVDLSDAETRTQYLESTGVIIFDHPNKVMYGCISERCDEQLFLEHAKQLGYEAVVFHAYDLLGNPIYHTNVMMGVQASTAVICAESITDAAERERVVSKLKATGHEIVEISYTQMAAFCGNILELRNDKNEHFLAMSQSAYDSFTSEQRNILAQDKTLLPFTVPTIETIGGGSVRCMLAEVFLPSA